ncbi:hypothetical protein FSP39_016787 [Pinctada imbricata]|uniref:Uncharacterized protein n=1 Tax=Pinctada imbricata TaxID=66713 RepID=A0AA88XSS8_PINIB|nr:hypothetical protein FSP39_016787 [Pinctada imbricata]
MWRSAASNKRTLLLYEGDSVVVEFCFSSVVRLHILNVRYSNDGDADDFTLMIDNNVLGKVSSSSLTRWGHAWNDFRDSGPLGESMIVHSGNHKLIMSVTNSDNYGVEVDSVDFDLTAVPSDEIYFCKHGVRQETVFHDIYPPVLNRDRVGRHRLEGVVRPFECLEKSNVEVCVVSTQYKGMTLEATSEWLNKTGYGEKWRDYLVDETLCDSPYQTVWQIGQRDGSNREFGKEGVSDILMTFSVRNLIANSFLFPRSVTSTFIQFNFPFKRSSVDFKKAYFSFGIVSPTNVVVSLRMLDIPMPKHSMRVSSDFPTATWEIPLDKLSTIGDNRLLLTFSDFSSPILVDYVRLYLEKAETKKINIAIDRTKFFELYGKASFSGSNGPAMAVSTERAPIFEKFSEISLMARKGSKIGYRKVLTLVADGRFFLYTIAEALPLEQIHPNSISRVSGLDLRPHGNGAYIRRVDFHLTDQWVNFTFSDDSKAAFQFSVVGDVTKLILQEISLASTADQERFACYFSKQKNEQLSGLKGVTVDRNKLFTVNGEWVIMNGTHFHFDHENAFWYKQAGSDYVIRFPN